MNLFTKGSHQRNLSVIFLLKNLYFQGKIMRTLSLNAAYLILFKKNRDKLQMLTLGKQMYPGKTEQFIQKYEAAVQRPYGYLFVDLKPNTPDECRLRTNVLPSDQSSTQAPTPSRSSAESTALQSMANYFKRQGYLQSPLLKPMQNINDQMKSILKEPNVPAEIKSKEYNQLFNRYLGLQQQLPNSVVVRPRQEVVQTIPPLADESHLSASNFETPENVHVTSDGGFTTTKTPSFLKRITSKIRPSTSRPSTSVEVPSTPLKAHSEMGQPTTLLSTPNTPSGPPIFPPTPPPSKDKPLKWIPYQDSGKYEDVSKSPRRSERLRAMVKSLPKWQNC
ncbi:hypothetical protein QZH41_006799 [Actinostola sp. cb2023]|nr:hypothetical protein QZH41_006799 [Actinostola sp. cb2023]